MRRRALWSAAATPPLWLVQPQVKAVPSAPHSKALVAAGLALLAAVLLCPGCRGSKVPDNAPSPRIVSFSPALTKIMFDIGLGPHVVGVTNFCELPAGQSRPVVGNLQSVNVERILIARPDVLLIQQDPSKFLGVQQADPRIRIEHFSIETLADISQTVERLGRIAGDEALGRQRRREFEDKIQAVRQRVANLPRPRVLFLVGINPPSIAGRASFVHDLIDIAGGLDVTADYDRWAQINVERVIIAKPEVIVCQSDPSEREEAMKFLKGLQQVPAVDNGRLFVVTDRNWTIPSTKMADLAANLAEMLHPTPASGGAKP